MTLRSKLGAALLIVTAVGCSKDSTAPVNVVCTVTLSGALTNSATCSTPIAALYTASNDSSTVSGGLIGTPALAVNIKSKGIPKKGTFHSNDAGALGFVSASSGANGWIAQTTGVVGGGAATGSWTLVLTSVTEAPAGSGIYLLHGSVDATMNPFGGGTVLTGHVTF
ncbi:MAG TPA: hypothetical protein VF483_07785 [Gemmatimonadaceae bacterium]